MMLVIINPPRWWRYYAFDHNGGIYIKAKKNILMIMTDQLRSDWIGCSGNNFVNTPNIDRIAKNGMMFSRAVCNSPVCTPSRSSFTAGVYPHRLGVLDNYVNFPIDRPTIYQELRRAGYRVGVVGKTDLHKYDTFYGEDGDNPIMYHWGFTDPHETIGKMSVATYKDESNNCPYKKYLLGKGLVDDIVNDYKKRLTLYTTREYPVWYSAPSVLPAEDNHESYIGRKACEYIENASTHSPWHLFVSFVGPHDPWDAPEEYYRMYKDRIYPDSIEDDMKDKPAWVKKVASIHSDGLNKEDCNRVKQQYAGMITLIDDWVGKMLDILEAKKLRDNTVVIFCSDHGEMLGDHGMFQKEVMYEGSVRVPLIISDPSFGMTGVSDSLAELVDLYPTMLDLAEIDCKTDTDGKSLVPILEGMAADHKKYQFSELDNTRMIFDGRYKYIENRNDVAELYDLDSDPNELDNIADSNPGAALDLMKKMRVLRK